MKRNLPDLQQEIDAIQLGLLRYTHYGKRITLHVKISIQDRDSLNCLMEGEAPRKLLHKKVTLIQKKHDTYIYICGTVTAEARNILAIDIKKACWFIRKREGSVTWLQEKCVYLPAMKLAS